MDSRDIESYYFNKNDVIDCKSTQELVDTCRVLVQRGYHFRRETYRIVILYREVKE